MKLNKEQMEFLLAKEPIARAQCGPGSGKTKTATEIVKHWQNEFDNPNILVVSFTKKAVAEIASRIEDLTNVTVSTLHAWAWRKLEDLSKRRGFTYEIMSDQKIKQVMKRIIQNQGIDESREEYWTGITSNNLFWYWNTRDSSKYSKPDQMKGLIELYVKYKRANGLFDFTDLTYLLSEKLKYYNETIEEFDMVIIDESQDLDIDQFNIIRSFEATYIRLLSDMDQSIYMWRDAKPEELDAITNVVYRFKTNYRSKQEIIDTAFYIRSTCLEEECEPMTAARGTGGNVTINGDISGALERGAQILVRSNAERKAIENTGYPHVMTIHGAKGLEFPEVIAVWYEKLPAKKFLEEINIMFVAHTRAEDSLYLSNFDSIVKYAEETMIEQKSKQNTENLF